MVISTCNIQWTSDNRVPAANITFVKRSEKYEATLQVKSGLGKPIVTNQKIVFKETDGAGEEFALRLFGKGGALVFETQPKS